MSARCFSWLTLLAVAVWSVWNAPAQAAEPAAPKARILFVTQSKGFRHGSVNRAERELAPAEIAVTELGEKTGLFTVHCTQDCATDFTRANLQNYDIVAFYTTGDLPIAQEDLDYFFNDWLKQAGHGVLGFHSAADTFHNYEPYYTMIGGTFIGHPWGSGSTVTLVSHDPDHICVKPFGKEFVIRDEIYMYRNWRPENVRVLLSLDYARSPTSGEVNAQYGYHVPVCWVREWGAGKVYFNNLGHNETTWTNPAFLESIANAVKWIRGLEPGDATPNPEVSREQEELSRKAAHEHGFRIRPPK